MTNRLNRREFATVMSGFLFPVGVRKRRLFIDTRQGFTGLDKEIDVSGQSPKGPHCVGI